MQLIAQNRKYFDVLLQILVIDSKLKGTYTLLMGFSQAIPIFEKLFITDFSVDCTPVHELGSVHELGTYRIL